MLKNPAAFLTLLLTLLFVLPADGTRVKRVVLHSNSNKIAVDAAGNAYVTGIFFGRISFGAQTLTNDHNQPKMFIVKYDPEGNVLWAKNTEGAGYCKSQDITVDRSGNFYITGAFSDTVAFGGLTLTSNGDHDIFIARFNTSGDVIWVQKAGGKSYDQGNAIAVDTAGNCYITGSLTDNTNIQVKIEAESTPTRTVYRQRTIDIFIAKYDHSGQLIWSKQIDRLGYDKGNSIAVDKAGNCYVTGEAVGGYKGELRVTEIFLSKYDPWGNEVWAKHFSPGERNGGPRIALGDSGHCYVAGSYGTPTDGTGCDDCSIFMAKYDSTGNNIWKQYAFAFRDNGIASGIALDRSGNVMITGYFWDQLRLGRNKLKSKGSYDIFLAKIDAAGQPVWIKNDGGKQWDEGHDIAADASGNIYVTGFYDGSTYGPNRYFIAKYDASGNMLWRERAKGQE